MIIIRGFPDVYVALEIWKMERDLNSEKSFKDAAPFYTLLHCSKLKNHPLILFINFPHILE